ncbi:MAG: hypothetical protein KDK56_07985 [Simkania sp.]|nr:hypothetical protein [Simkania sp.]
MDTTQEQWGSYFPNLFGCSPFTIIFLKTAVSAATPALIHMARLSSKIESFGLDVAGTRQAIKPSWIS